MFDGEKVRLRALELTDLDAIMEHWNDLEMRLNTGRTTPDSRQNREDFIRNAWKLKEEGRNYFFGIEEKKTKEYLGHCSLYLINKIARSSGLGIFIYNKKNWNKGYGTDAMKVLLKIGFEFLNFHRIELSVYPYNTRGIHVYKKLGFREVGRRREARFMSGKYIDEIMMDLLKSEWEKRDY